jgi:hypothetical protein
MTARSSGGRLGALVAADPKDVKALVCQHSARMRREESRGDRLPGPVDFVEGGIGRVEALEQINGIPREQSTRPVFGITEQYDVEATARSLCCRRTRA